jgi:PST family polysaccharide transporter
VGLFLSNVIIAAGRTAVLLSVQICALAALLPGLPAGINLGGIEGAAAAHVLVIVAVTSPVYVIALRRSTGLRVRALFIALSRPATTSTLTALVAWVATRGLENPLHKILIAGVVGFCLYVFLNRSDLAPLVPSKILRRLSGTKRPRSGKGRYRSSE